MRRSLCLLILVLVAVTAAAFDFRHTNWGMSSADVISSESGSLYQNDNSSKDPRRTATRFDVVINGYNGWLTYHFYDNRLFMATYQFFDTADFLAYQSIRKSIFDKYGEPKSADARGAMWRTDRSVLVCEFRRDTDPGSRGNMCMVFVLDKESWTRLGRQQTEENSSNF